MALNEIKEISEKIAPPIGYDDLRPYNDSEIPEAMIRLANDPLLGFLVSNLFRENSLQEIKDVLLGIKTVYEFQHRIMHKLITNIERYTTSGVEITGYENLDKNKSHLFVANHRDIVLDSAFLQVGLDANGFKTSEITFGSNLMKPQFAVDFGKSNKMFKVIRDANVRDFIKISQQLSEYLRYTIKHKNESVWIAQRSGRTKDGLDQTDPGIVKMFAMSGQRNHELDALKELNIVPLVISYQYEPCDYLKARELYLTQQAPYQKEPWEDVKSIAAGVLDFKGKIVMRFMPCINDKISGLEFENRNDLFKYVAKIIDAEIYKGFELFDTNYMAYDILNNTNKFEDRYSPIRKKEFIDLMNKKITSLEFPAEGMKEHFLKIYANPLITKGLAN